jgi:hypothetical protein
MRYVKHNHIGGDSSPSRKFSGSPSIHGEQFSQQIPKMGFEGASNAKAKFQKNGGRPWRETWTVNGCGTLVPVVVDYVPDETSTLIQVPAN